MVPKAPEPVVRAGLIGTGDLVNLDLLFRRGGKLLVRLLFLPRLLLRFNGVFLGLELSRETGGCWARNLVGIEGGRRYR